MKTLKPDFADKLLTGKDLKNKEYTQTLAMHFKCTKQDIINLIESKSDKLTSPNYLVMIKKVLGLPPNIEIAMEVENVA